VVHRFVEGLSPFLRLAVGMQALLPSQGRDAAYGDLLRRLQLHRLDVVDAQEFTLQINRPRQSQVLNGLLVNRLSKWSVHRRILTAQAGGTGRVIQAPPNFGMHVETDVNTDGELEEPLPRERVTGLVDELIRLSLELIEQGEIR
jgi:hypothetical protein